MAEFFNAGSHLIIWALIVAVVVGVAYVSHKRRQKLWMQWCEQLGWEFRDDWSEGPEMFTGGPFGRGRSRKMYLTAAGRYNGLLAMTMAYRFTVGSGKNKRTYIYQIYRVILPGARFPTVEVRRENAVVDFFSPDIDFEDKAFNDAWRITSPNRPFAHALFHQRAIEWFNRVHWPDFHAMWLEGDSVLVAQKGHQRPEQVPRYLEALTAWAQTFPRFLLRDIGAPHPLPLTAEGLGPAPGRAPAPLPPPNPYR